MHESAFQYRWDTQGGKKEFKVQFNACSQKPTAWKEEIYSAARRVAESTTKPLWLCLSGGIDSEIMADAFVHENIPFSVLTNRYSGGLNDHDIYYAKKWCQQHAVSQKIIDIDILEFIRTDVEAYIKEGYVADMVFRYLQVKTLETVESLGGYAVMGGGEQLFYFDPHIINPIASDLYLEFEPGRALVFEWCRRNNTAHEPYFYFATPELCLSHLEIPMVAFAVEQQPYIFRNEINSLLFKRIIYQAEWPELEPRYKYHGFERIITPIIAFKEKMGHIYGDQLKKYRLPVPLFRDQLTGKLPHR